MHRIVAYTFLKVCEKKIHQFLSSIKTDAHRRKLVPFFLSHGVQGFNRTAAAPSEISLCQVQPLQVNNKVDTL